MIAPCLHFDCDNRNSFGYCKTTCCINPKYNRQKTKETSNCNPRIVTVIKGSPPFTDFVKVVRCKDCEAWQIDWNPSVPDRHYCAVMDSMMKADDFCSYGERREE